MSLYYGIEFEMAIAWLPPSNTDPNSEYGREVRFHPLWEDFNRQRVIYQRGKYKTRADAALDFYGPGFSRASFAIEVAIRHIARTMDRAGFPIDIENLEAGKPQFWGISEDCTISFPTGFDKNVVSKYLFLPIEIQTAAYADTKEAAIQVKRFLELMRNTYRINIQGNESISTHVHVSRGTDRFDFTTIQRLLAFLWAFEPQINCIHESHRINSTWADAMREESYINLRWRNLHDNARPEPSDGICAILRQADTAGAIRLTRSRSGCKTSACNFQGILDDVPSAEKGVPSMIRKTIEFRQHAGSVEGMEVMQWVKTLTSIVEYCRDSAPAQFASLIDIVANYEEWEKLGDGQDEQRQSLMGPILAEEGFTVIHLLQQIGNYQSALYFSDKWQKHDKRVAEPSLVRRWDFQRPCLDLDAEEKLDQEALAQVCVAFERAYQEDQGWIFKKDDWPSWSLMLDGESWMTDEPA